MNTGLIIAMAAISGIFIMYRWSKQWNKAKRRIAALASSDARFSLKEELPQEETWWAQLDTPLQLELAGALAMKAMPVWQRYSETNELAYKNSPIGPAMSIRPALLQTSLDEVLKASLHGFPENNKHIINIYNEFVGPLVALQDGHWAIPYPVKKIFLAVYNLLKAIGEQENISLMKQLLSLSINQSLDCLDMCKIYSRDEIKSFLQSYRNQPAY